MPLENIFNRAERERRYYIFKITFTGYIILTGLMATDHLFLNERFFGKTGNIPLFIFNALINGGILLGFNFVSSARKETFINFVSVFSFFVYLTDTTYQHVVTIQTEGPLLDPKMQPTLSMVIGITVALVGFQTSLSKYQTYMQIYFTICISILAFSLSEHTLQGNISLVVCFFQFLVMQQNQKMSKLSVRLVLDSGRETQFYRNILQSFLPLPVAFVSKNHEFNPNQKFLDKFADTEYFVLSRFLIEKNHVASEDSKSAQSLKYTSSFENVSERDLFCIHSLHDYLESLYGSLDADDIECRPSKVLVSFSSLKGVCFFSVIIQKIFTVEKKDSGFMLLFEPVDMESSLRQEDSKKMVDLLAQAAHDLKSPCNNILRFANNFDTSRTILNYWLLAKLTLERVNFSGAGPAEAQPQLKTDFQSRQLRVLENRLRKNALGFLSLFSVDERQLLCVASDQSRSQRVPNDARNPSRPEEIRKNNLLLAYVSNLDGWVLRAASSRHFFSMLANGQYAVFVNIGHLP
jgi:hypothetical protein